MLRKYIYIVIAALLIVIQSNAQIRQGSSSTSGQNQYGNSSDGESETPTKEDKEKVKPKIPSIIRSWKVNDHGSRIQKSEMDTAMTFFHVYHAFDQKSISTTFTGNNGGAYISNDFFSRDYQSDFYFSRSFDAYWITPSQINYFNTTTPYALLDYSQSENKMTHNETRFNVFLTQNVNKRLNFGLIYNQTRSQGQYLNQENKFHTIALASSYTSNNFLSHSNIIFNRLQGMENGGIDSGQPLTSLLKTDDYTTQITDKAINVLKNNAIFTVNEYRVGKMIKADSAKKVIERFIPRVGFIHELEMSDNKRKFTKPDPKTFFKNWFDNDTLTHDSTQYTRLTNIFQIKFYEAPDRKYTFGKRVYIGNDQMWYHMSTSKNYYPDKQSNTFIGGGIFRNEGKFWQWEANGKIYLTGYRAGQTELTGFINKSMKIGKDNPSLRIEGSLKTLVPDYFDRYFYSNHYEWTNGFNNINEMTIRSSIHSQAFKTTVGINYSLIGNYIYNNLEAIPAQAGSELLVLSAYLNKDFESDHWLVRTQLLTQKASSQNYIHLPTFAGFISMNYRTIISKVMHFQLGVDTRYNTAFYADAYDPATARFYLQNKQLIGNYPYVDFHVNLKLKRTRIFFLMMNTASGLVGDNFYVAPDYPYYRRTYRIGVAWSFYD
jgi:hypothetical protein